MRFRHSAIRIHCSISGSLLVSFSGTSSGMWGCEHLEVLSHPGAWRKLKFRIQAEQGWHPLLPLYLLPSAEFLVLGVSIVSVAAGSWRGWVSDVWVSNETAFEKCLKGSRSSINLGSSSLRGLQGSWKVGRKVRRILSWLTKEIWRFDSKTWHFENAYFPHLLW